MNPTLISTFRNTSPNISRDERTSIRQFFSNIWNNNPNTKEVLAYLIISRNPDDFIDTLAKEVEILQAGMQDTVHTLITRQELQEIQFLKEFKNKYITIIKN